jgi:hypothetical protein
MNAATRISGYPKTAPVVALKMIAPISAARTPVAITNQPDIDEDSAPAASTATAEKPINAPPLWALHAPPAAADISAIPAVTAPRGSCHRRASLASHEAIRAMQIA